MDEFNLQNERDLLVCVSYDNLIYIHAHNLFYNDRFFLILYFQNSSEKIINSSEYNFHELVDDIPQTFETNNLKPKFQEMSGEKTQTLFNDFSTLSVDASEGYIFLYKTFQFYSVSYKI